MNPLTPVWDLPSIRPRGGELLPTVDMDVIPPQVERARRTLWAGLLVFRWVSFAWFAANAILPAPMDRPGPDGGLDPVAVGPAGEPGAA